MAFRPVIIPKSQYKRWLATEPERAEDLLELLAPYDPAEMKAYPVSANVNSPKNDGPECIESFAEESAKPPDEDAQQGLF